MKIQWVFLCLVFLLLIGCDTNNGEQSTTSGVNETVSTSTDSISSNEANNNRLENHAPDKAVENMSTSIDSSKALAVKISSESAASNSVLKLASKSGCFACHKIDVKLVGPAWQDVAHRYRDQKDSKQRLIAKVKKGGAGNWTDVTGGISMPPYSPRVSDSDVETLVSYILSLD